MVQDGIGLQGPPRLPKEIFPGPRVLRAHSHTKARCSHLGAWVAPPLHQHWLDYNGSGFPRRLGPVSTTRFPCSGWLELNGLHLWSSFGADREFKCFSQGCTRSQCYRAIWRILFFFLVIPLFFGHLRMESTKHLWTSKKLTSTNNQ